MRINECNEGSTYNGNTSDITVECTEGFYSVHGVCKPECGKWKEYSNAAVNTVDAFIITSISIALLAIAIILGLVYKKHNIL